MQAVVDDPTALPLAVGVRVRLNDIPDWISPWDQFARTGRRGVVLDINERGTPLIEFDVIRPGTKPKVGWTDPRGVVVLPGSRPEQGGLKNV